MSSVTPINTPLPGERVVALSPQDAATAAVAWLRRPNLFPGRALTAPTLQGRQQWQAGRIAQRGQAFTAGVVRGLELNHVLEGSTLQLMLEPGQGLTVSGEDVTLLQRLECELRALPVALPLAWFAPGQAPGATNAVELPVLPGEPGQRVIGSSVGAFLDAGSAHLNRAGVVLLQPVTVDSVDFDPADPCDRCACGDDMDPATAEDWRLADGVRLVWYPWPEGAIALPATTLRRRNALAYAVFEAEARLAQGQALPWELLGVPVALLGLDAAGGIAFSDRAAVVRQGGRAREARLQLAFDAPAGATRLSAHSRLPALWQARIEQFAEELAELGDPPPPVKTLADPFLHIPPCGLLPKNVLDLANFRCEFFPPLVTLDAVPVPLEQLDVALREAAPLAPVNLSAAERVRLLVPVPQASWEPRLLKKDVLDPEFTRTLNRFLLDRARELGARQGLRRKRAMLRHAIDGSQPAVPAWDDDPLALESESLSPWGPPPPGGGHRSALMGGLHQHFFDGATPAFTLAAGESLFAWVCLDPDHPPRTLMLQWRVGTSWEHRAYWGEDLIAWGNPATTPASRQRLGDLPEAGAWVRLQIPAAAVGLAGQPVNGMAFSLFDGRAAFGMAGATTANTWRKWFCNQLPAGARPQGNEAWELLSTNDLWAPFDAAGGVAPNLLPVQPPQASEALPLDSPLRLPSGGFNLQYAPGSAWRGHGVDIEDGDPGALLLKPSDFTEGIAPKLLMAVYLDEVNPPHSLVATLRLSQYGDEMAYWERAAFWGENRLDELARLLPAQAQLLHEATRAGALPPSSRWVWLEIPLPPDRDGVGLYEINLFACGGELAVSDITFGRPQPPTSTHPAWSLQAEPVWPRHPHGGGIRTTHQVLLGSGIALRGGLGVLTPTTTARTGVVPAYAQLMQDPALLRLSGHEQSQLLLRGVAGFADFLRTRIDRVDDITDFGFAHMQVDIHRLRQLMLSTSDASRLSVSPAIAAIAKSDSAVVVQSQIRQYLDTLNLRRAAQPSVLAGTAEGLMAMAAAAPAPTPTPGAAAMAAAAVKSSLLALPANSVTTAVRLAQSQPRSLLLRKPSAPEAIVYANPVVGLSTVRTTAIADRLKSPPSTEARDYALANRQRTVASLVELVKTLSAQDSGELPSVFDGFVVYGLKDDPFLRGSNQPTQRALTDFLAQPELLTLLLLPPVTTGAEDEALLFSQTVALSDNTVALLRQLEGRLTVYRDALGRCEAVLQTLQGHWSDAAQRLQAVEERLAEARHDVGVTRALIAEEEARLAAINERRARVLAEEVRFVAYMRPREAAQALQAPWRAVDPALAEAPVPACLRSHPDVPDELAEMLKVVREAPAAWFVDVPALVERLDRGELLLRTLRGAQSRSTLLAQRGIVAPSTLSGSRIGTALAQLLTRQAPLLAARAERLNRLQWPLLATATWQGLRVQVQEVVSLGDLAEGEHGRGEVSRLAAELFDRMAGVCTCLHAELSAVLPSIRLDWAEQMSQFDETPSLRDLSNLPRFSEIDSLDRRRMQAYADWLFARVDPRQAQAEALVNDVVRMCLLLASHAPVGRIVAGRLARPVGAVRPGVSLPLAALEPARLRVGMQALVYRNNAVVARAVVEDIGAAEVSARVLHVAAGQESLGMDVRVHFDDAPVVSTSPARSGGAFKRVPLSLF
ncbi:hypothetical protein [Azohydromonas lata]|uniref:hypothetical protein n=1 Tax=Azohydromonas lata TaxID=45677 RepID=UPI0008302518|nr:hypothetical protein [Azohydromonas lata]